MSDLLREFMDQQTEEEKRLRQLSMDNTSAEGGALPLKVSGTYLMEVATYAFRDKDSKKMRVSPEPYVSNTKNSLNLTLCFKVVDGTPQAPKGSSIFTNLVLSPASGADQDKVENINRMLKPRLAVLTGEENVKLDADWFEEWLIAKFEEREGKFHMTKDHKMKKRFLAVVEDDVFNDKDVLRVSALLEANENSKSVSNDPLLSQQIKQESSTPSPEDFNGIDVDAAAITEVDIENSEIPDVPPIEDYS